MLYLGAIWDKERIIWYWLHLVFYARILETHGFCYYRRALKQQHICDGNFVNRHPHLRRCGSPERKTWCKSAIGEQIKLKRVNKSSKWAARIIVPALLRRRACGSAWRRPLTGLPGLGQKRRRKCRNLKNEFNAEDGAKHWPLRKPEGEFGGSVLINYAQFYKYKPWCLCSPWVYKAFHTLVKVFQWR